MSGGLGKKHYGHYRSWRVASDYLADKKNEDMRLQLVIESLPKSKVGICSVNCLVYNKKTEKCGALGVIAPIDEECAAQLKLRRER